MPNPPRFVLPPTLLARVETLRSQATAGRPTRQAVVEAALARGLDALEGGPVADEATMPGVAREVVYGVGAEGPGGSSLKTILFGHAPTPVEQARTLLAAMVARLPCLPEREDLEAALEALGGADGCEGRGGAAGAPSGRVGAVAPPTGAQ